MRRDLQSWEEALQLASRLSPTQVPEISREFAAQQEFEGNYSGALINYERCIQGGVRAIEILIMVKIICICRNLIMVKLKIIKS